MLPGVGCRGGAVARASSLLLASAEDEEEEAALWFGGGADQGEDGAGFDSAGEEPRCVATQRFLGRRRRSLALGLGLAALAGIALLPHPGGLGAGLRSSSAAGAVALASGTVDIGDADSTKWTISNGKCLGAVAWPARAGDTINIRDCSSDDPAHSYFVFPKHAGMITLSGELAELCLEARVGEELPESQRGQVTLQRCQDRTEGMLWSIPFEKGPLRLEYGDWCIDDKLPDGMASIELKVEQCSMPNVFDQYPKAGASWACHDLAEGQDEQWCESVGTSEGYEYKWVGANSTTPETHGFWTCGFCWCCKRPVPTTRTSSTNTSTTETPTSKMSTWTATSTRTSSTKTSTTETPTSKMSTWTAMSTRTRTSSTNTSTTETPTSKTSTWTATSTRTKTSSTKTSTTETRTQTQTSTRTTTEFTMATFYKEFANQVLTQQVDDGSRQGQIAWKAVAGNGARLCLSANPAQPGTVVRVGACDTGFSQWRLPGPEGGRIRTAVGQELCIVASDEAGAGDGAVLTLSHCDEGDPAGLWVLPHEGEGSLSLLDESGLLVGRCAWAEEVGWAVQLHVCDPVMSEASQDACPWMESTGEVDVMECEDGTRCDADTRGWDCCLERGGRIRCPVNEPKMCMIHTCSGGGEYCCSNDCNSVGSEDRPCPAGQERWAVEAMKHVVELSFPTLYCLSIMMENSYEQDILQTALAQAAHMEKDIGIFGCEGFDVFSQHPVKLGWHQRSGWVETVHFEQATVGRSEDDSAGNTLIFMNMWEEVKRLGKYKWHDWTIKADPDAVVFADRLRVFLAPHSDGDAKFLMNCNLYPNAPGWPALFGALEAMTRDAMNIYFDQEWNTCRNLPWQPWGEDKFLRNCFEALNIPYFLDTKIIGDKYCGGVQCSDFHGAYHPFKSSADWMGCWEEAEQNQESISDEEKSTRREVVDAAEKRSLPMWREMARAEWVVRDNSTKARAAVAEEARRANEQVEEAANEARLKAEKAQEEAKHKKAEEEEEEAKKAQEEAKHKKAEEEKEEAEKAKEEAKHKKAEEEEEEAEKAQEEAKQKKAEEEKEEKEEKEKEEKEEKEEKGKQEEEKQDGKKYNTERDLFDLAAELEDEELGKASRSGKRGDPPLGGGGAWGDRAAGGHNATKVSTTALKRINVLSERHHRRL